MMTEKGDTKEFSLEEIKKMRAEGLSLSRDDAPHYEVDPAFWEGVRVTRPIGKKSVHLRLDEDVFEWFKSQGSGHLTYMNAVLRSYYESRT